MDITPPTIFTFLLFYLSKLLSSTKCLTSFYNFLFYFLFLLPLLLPFLLLFITSYSTSFFYYGCEVTAFYWKSQIHFAVTWKNCNFAADSSFYSYML